jgi:hypothetical protein
MEYMGVSRAAPEISFGQTVVIYYDTQDPKVNALKDFSEQSRTNKHFIYIFLLVLAAVFIAIVWDRGPYPRTSGKHTT